MPPLFSLINKILCQVFPPSVVLKMPPEAAPTPTAVKCVKVVFGGAGIDSVTDATLLVLTPSDAR